MSDIQDLAQELGLSIINSDPVLKEAVEAMAKDFRISFPDMPAKDATLVFSYFATFLGDISTMGGAISGVSATQTLERTATVLAGTSFLFANEKETVAE